MSARLLAGLAALLALFVASRGFARPGGGSTYRGGSSSKSSSSSSSSRSSSSSGSSTRTSSGSSTSTGSSSRSSGSSTSSGTSSGSSSRSTGTSTGTDTSTGTSTSSGSDDGGAATPDAPASPAPPPAPLWFTLLFLLVLIGGPIIALVLAYRFITGFFRKSWTTSAGPREDAAPGAPVERPITHVEEAIAALQGRDDAFSRALLEDFLYALFAEVMTHRPRLEVLAAYLAPGVREIYDRRPVDAVRDIVVGALRITRVGVDRGARKLELTVEFEANYTEIRAGAEQSYYVAEEWRLVRSADAKSREPDAARAITCPHCGAPLDRFVAGKCGYCGHVATEGLDDWYVVDVSILGREERGPMLTGETEEVGTDLPTVVDANVNALWRALGERDPSVTWESFTARVAEVFGAFYDGWSRRDLSRVRPYLSDGLFATQQYWIKAYVEAKLRNIAGDPRLTSVQLARVTTDKFYDAITVRIYATCYDHTVDDAGNVVSGSRERPRVYSEYWTFLRGRGAKGARRGVAPECPSCGAPLAVNMAGCCAHCDAKVTRGDFDFVLSRIEQDESYG